MPPVLDLMQEKNHAGLFVPPFCLRFAGKDSLTDFHFMLHLNFRSFWEVPKTTQRFWPLSCPGNSLFQDVYAYECDCVYMIVRLG